MRFERLPCGATSIEIEHAALSAWDADRYVAYAKDGKVCVTAQVETRGDPTKLHAALTNWARALPVAEVQRQDKTIRLHSCVPSASARS